jgi:colanic acid biosynthesis protein WcaH
MSFEENLLPPADFHNALQALPLVSVDWVIVNRLGEVLTGFRENAPAQHTWFTPGGRIRKGEPVSAALARVAMDELGVSATMAHSWVDRARLMGVWDHFFSDSVAGQDTPTHYVNLPHALVLQDPDEFVLQELLHGKLREASQAQDLYWAQHGSWCWQPTGVPNNNFFRAHDYVQPYLRWVAEHIHPSGVFK